MHTSTEIIRAYINKNIKELDREILSKEEIYKNDFDNNSVDVVRMETGEDIIISYTDISITGTDRAKPQIRIFMDKQKYVYQKARKRKMRYFLLTIFSKDIAMARNINYFDPRDFIVAIETNVDYESSRRDLRSLYDYLDEYIKEHGDVDYLRCTQGQHHSGIYQASFIRIKKNGIDIPDILKNYITYFDNRPYMQSIGEENHAKQRERINYAYNRIVFGAPGTGKSFRLEEESKVFGARMERVTFHPNYSYAQFVGTYKPIQGEKGTDITYEYVPGPFMRMYSEAVNHPENNYLLLIEEINRANVAAVFGDIFQLLDRKNGISMYKIATSEDVRKYLLKTLCGSKLLDECEEHEREKCMFMKLPNNMYIWATMNSADQGVYPMDTAFKRRWEFEYIGVDDEKQMEAIEDYYIPMCINNTYYVKWQELRNHINMILSSDKCNVNEDKLLGPFFISKNILDEILDTKHTRDNILNGVDTESDINEVEQKEKSFIRAFESKVLMYLFEDVMKMRPNNIFIGYNKNHGSMIFSNICAEFEEKGENIFGISLQNKTYGE